MTRAWPQHQGHGLDDITARLEETRGCVGTNVDGPSPWLKKGRGGGSADVCVCVWGGVVVTQIEFKKGVGFETTDERILFVNP